eukprot:s2512_g4.t1
MYMCQEKSITQQDFLDLKSKVDWLEIHGASAMTRKTMWLVGEGCRCPYNYGQQQVNAMTFPDWFMVMAKRWLECLNLNGEDCNTTPFPVVKHASPALQQDKDGRFPDCVNLNLYETGDHQVSWHSDDEPLFRGKFQDARIISVTLGAMRKFQVGLKAPRRGGILKPERGSVCNFNLGHGERKLEPSTWICLLAERLLQESKQRLKQQRAHAAVEVALSQWEKGETKGLMAVVVKDWHKYQVTASNGRMIRGAGTLEEKLLLATLRLCLQGWRGHLDIQHARTSAKELRESLDMQRLNLVFAMWRLCNLEEKKEQAFGQVAEISAIAFELQQAQTSLLEDKILLEGKVEKAFEALQKELQTKEELAAELREAYSKQAEERITPPPCEV